MGAKAVDEMVVRADHRRGKDDRGASHSDRTAGTWLLTGLAVVSTAGMAMEIMLSRVFSVLFFYHYVFAVLSGAVLGIAVGAAVVHHRGVPADVLRRLQRLTLLAGGGVLGLTLLIATTVSVDSRLLLACAAGLPYVLIGMTMTTVFSTWAEKSPSLYWADLGGAGLGAPAAIMLLNWLGGLQALWVTALLFVAASICFQLCRQPRQVLRAETAFAAVLVLLTVAGLASGQLQVDMGRLATPKPLTRQLQDDPQARIAYTDWDAFARVDVLESEAEPWRKQIFINGAAGSLMPRAPTSPEDEARLTGDVGYFPFRAVHNEGGQDEPALSVPRRVFVVGPGGGRDLFFARLAGSEHVTAVEVSPGVVRAVQRFGDYNGHLLERPSVSLAVDEGRSYLRRSGMVFDLISLSEVIALTTERGSYILTENYAYTVEAFHDYLDHLAPGGRLALRLYDELTLTRAFVTVVTALKERGLTEAEATRRVVVLLDPQLVSSEAPFRSPVLILYRGAVTPEAAEHLLTAIRRDGFIPLFVPHVHERPPLSALTTGETTLESLVRGFSRADISATTDMRPFFYEFRRGLPGLLRRLLGALGVATALAVVYVWWQGKGGLAAGGAGTSFWGLALYFALLGAAYMMMELAVVQRLTLFLGHPTTALAVGLFAALISSGLGSLVAGQVTAKRLRRVQAIRVASIAAAVLGSAFVPLLPLLTGQLAIWPLLGRSLAAIGVVFPLFFCLGVPFALGLQIAQIRVGSSMIPLAWGINGLASVIGSVGAVAIAMLWHFDGLIVVASVLYGAVALLAGSFGRT